MNPENPVPDVFDVDVEWHDDAPVGVAVWRRMWQVLSVVVMVLTVVALVWVWPSKFGGATTVVVVAGESMLPTLQPDDAVVMRSTGDYEVGDVVVYPISGDGAGSGRLVIHRIVGGDAVSGWVTQGDNRATADPWRPTSDDIVGEQVWHVPGGGAFIRGVVGWVLTPWVWAVFVMVVVFWAARTWDYNRRLDVEDEFESDSDDVTGGDVGP